MKLHTRLLVVVFVALAASSGASEAQTAGSDVMTVRGTVVSQEPAPGSWLLELDRGVDTVNGRMRSVSLVVSEKRVPTHPITVGNRLEVDGRLLVPTFSGGPGILEPTRITQLSDPGLTHAYFLFRSGKSEACAECYVPLLLSGTPIGTSSIAPLDVEVIVTFERDSIWEIRDRAATISDIEAKARTLRLDGRSYRYQEVSPQEAIRLLRNPLGSIPISRPTLADAPTTTRCRALLFRLGVREP